MGADSEQQRMKITKREKMLRPRLVFHLASINGGVVEDKMKGGLTEKATVLGE
jgi:hypothetical protein